MTISSDGHTQLDTLQKAIDGYKERLEQIKTDPSIISVTGNTFVLSYKVNYHE